jgi:hypothetical protein
MKKPAKTKAARCATFKIPAIKKGEIYAGITLHEGKPMHLVLLPGDEKKNWKDAAAWAKAQGGELPNRHDALVLFENKKTRGKHEATWYWTSQTYASNADYAWYQDFGYGSQYDDHKSNENRCRAVRRVAI